MNALEVAAARRKWRGDVAKLVGPVSLLVLEELIAQLPKGNNIDGFFLPDHKAIMAEKKLTKQVYFAIMHRLEQNQLIIRKRKAFGTKRGIWYKMDFDRFANMITGARDGN
jgi:hypothetical protein